MNSPRQLQDLVADVVHTYSEAQVDFDPLPSGICFLWVTVNGRNFVIEHDPKDVTGVSENLPDTPPFVGHDEVYPSLDDAIARFKALLADAACSEPAAASAGLIMQDKPISN